MTKPAKELNRMRGWLKAKLTAVEKLDADDEKKVNEKTKLECQQKLLGITELKIELKKLFEQYGKLHLEDIPDEYDAAVQGLEKFCDTLR